MNIESIHSMGVAQQAVERDSGTNALRQPQAKTEQAPDQDQASATSPTSKSSVDQAVKQLSDFVSLVRPEISFSTDEASGVQVVRVLDSQSGEVIRQIPSEEAIQMAQVLDKLQGLFVKEKV